MLDISLKKQENILNGLYIVSTPIGNLQDVSFRAIEILKKSKVILCENSSHSTKLLKIYGIKKTLISFHDYNEKMFISKFSKLINKSIVALISDAGSPLISDPGYKLIKYCIDNKIFITSVPGPSAIIPALQLSGIACNSFLFSGFIPKKIKQIEDFFRVKKNIKDTQVFFSSSHNLKKNIEIMYKYFGNRKIVICRELTKIHEDIIRTNIPQAINYINTNKINIKGELVLVVDGNVKPKEYSIDENIITQLIKISKNLSINEAAKIMHKITGLPKKDLYSNALIKLKKK